MPTRFEWGAQVELDPRFGQSPEFKKIRRELREFARDFDKTRHQCLPPREWVLDGYTKVLNWALKRPREWTDRAKIATMVDRVGELVGLAYALERTGLLVIKDSAVSFDLRFAQPEAGKAHPPA
jgi:hypothetical protein